MAGLHIDYRPKNFDEFIGNDETVDALVAMLQKENKPHALLFTGPSGCGKTTLARIVAQELGCNPEMDLKEIDVADNRGIETSREIIHQMRLKPLGGPCRVWIMDEVHRSTSDGQSALLKALEDTPSHCYFLLCTTDPDKLLPTILNRCTRFEVRSLVVPELVTLLEEISEAEQKPVPKDVLKQIATGANGSPRRALVTLDKVIDLPEDKMLEMAKFQEQTETQIIELCRAMIGKSSWKSIAGILKGLNEDPEKVRYSILRYMDSVMLGAKDSNDANLNRAYLVGCAFKNPFYSSGKSGLIQACFEALFT